MAEANTSNVSHAATGVSSTEAPFVGILTKTVVYSPVVNWIVHARLRRRDHNDVVLVGDDFIHVKEVQGGGHLRHVATKSDFDSRIRAARVFNNDVDPPDEDEYTKPAENRSAVSNGKSQPYVCPPQFLVLTLDSNDLVFIYIDGGIDGPLRFLQQHCPIPTFDNILHQPGQHLTVDPWSRAVAVGACEQEVIIYAAKPKEQVRYELKNKEERWCPVLTQRVIRIEGVVIQNMEFLYPPADDEDHVILLLLVVDQRKTKAIYIDWWNADVRNAQIHTAQPLDVAKNVPSLLIPLHNGAEFLLTHGSEIKRFRGLLTGSVVGMAVAPVTIEPLHPGASSKVPAWANWARPRRGPGHRQRGDAIYLAREDGLIYYTVASYTDTRIQLSHAANFGCHVGTAFACLGDSGDPDILAVPGEMSRGGIWTIGSWRGKRVSDMSREDTMDPKLVEHTPNWASVTDVLVSSVPKGNGKAPRSRDGIFVTSGRLPFGAITELRKGIEAHLRAYFELEGLRSVTDIWALPALPAGSIALLLSSPSDTRILEMPSDMSDAEDVDEAKCAFDLSEPTLAAALTVQNGQDLLVQVTEGSICVTSNIHANFEDSFRRKLPEAEKIVAAAICQDSNMIIAVERQNALHTLCLYVLVSGADFIAANLLGTPVSLYGATNCVAAFGSPFGPFAITVSANGVIQPFRLAHVGITALQQSSLPLGVVCESMSILGSGKTSGRAFESYVLLCGLRDGSLYVLELELDVSGMITFGASRTMSFGITAVKIVADPESSCRAFVSCGLDFCALTWNCLGLDGISVASVWVTDKDRPALAQRAITAVTRLPPEEQLAHPEMASSLTVVSGDECLVVRPDDDVSTVPRQILLNGTPNRLLYSERLRCFVSASLRTGIRSFPSSRLHSPPEERRQVWPVIEFSSASGDDWSRQYELQPGERVYSLLEWTYETPDKTWAFILVGSNRLKSDGTQKGKITFLQPVSQESKVVVVKEGRTQNTDSPVYALALYDDKTIVAAVGTHISIFRFSPDERRWNEMCLPYKLASPAVQITASRSQIHITTLLDSYVHLTLEVPSSGHGNMPHLVPVNMGPRADSCLSHLLLTLPAHSSHDDQSLQVDGINTDSSRSLETSIILMSTKAGQIVGLSSADLFSASDRHSRNARILFEANLPRSLTRLRHGNITLPWRPKPPIGVSHGGIVGSAADGTLIGVAIVDEKLWRRLSWVQRLCERSAEICPQMSRYAAEDTASGLRDDHQTLPLGFRSQEPASPVSHTNIGPRLQPSDMHINGDIIARLLDWGGVKMLQQIMIEQSKKDDQIGTWLRQHLDEEMQQIDDVIEEIRTVLDAWI